MSINSGYGDTIKKSQDFCRKCGGEINEISAGLPSDDHIVQLKLTNKDTYIKARRMQYHQPGGEGVTATSKHSIIRICPSKRSRLSKEGVLV